MVHQVYSQTILSSWLIGLAGFLVAIIVPQQGLAQNQIQARIVLIIPNGAQAPSGYEARLQSVGIRAERFFAKWMKYWGYPLEREAFFSRGYDNKIQIVLVKGTLRDGKNKSAPGELKKMAIRMARAKLKLGKRQKAVWWVFYKYPNVKGFHGGGNANSGMAVNAYPSGNQTIGPDVLLAAKSINATQLKGSIHEFGHALGLPHNGPLKGLKLGNSLMGPITPVYQKKMRSKEQRVYLNESSAALIWKHPLFRRTGPRRANKPGRFELKDLECREDEKGIIHVCGQILSERKIHSAVVFDSRTGNYGNYWIRSHAERIDGEGKFDVGLWSPNDKGRLFLQFCFEDGFNTANGKQQKSQIKVTYSGKPGKRKFGKPERG